MSKTDQKVKPQIRSEQTAKQEIITEPTTKPEIRSELTQDFFTTSKQNVDKYFEHI
jgi:short-subunit dehydrogenase involved in D-alanine esterification of teichoic acids